MVGEKKIKAHFKKVDPVIYGVIDSMSFGDWVKPITGKDKFFLSLCTSIISQQLATGAARTISGRFIDLFEVTKITPSLVLGVSDQKLRDVGLSWSKVSYVKDLAQKSFDEDINYSVLTGMGQEEVVAELTQVRGIGVWTAEMFLIFALGREDIFSYLDLGLRKGMKELYGLRKMPSAATAKRITNKWKPYRSYGSIALWESLDN